MWGFYRFPRLLASERRQLFSHLFSFTFVRHPFTRFVSFYQDKVIDLNQMVGKIPRNYTRTPADRRKYPGKRGSRCIAVLGCYFTAMFLHVGKPTFSEFVDFHLSGGTASDIHSFPYYSRCAMCLLDYDVIGKQETAEDDIK